MKTRILNLKRSLPVLNRHPGFREAVGRIFAIRKLSKSEAETAGLSCHAKGESEAINKLFDGVKPYEPPPK